MKYKDGCLLSTMALAIVGLLGLFISALTPNDAEISIPLVVVLVGIIWILSGGKLIQIIANKYGL